MLLQTQLANNLDIYRDNTGSKRRLYSKAEGYTRRQLESRDPPFPPCFRHLTRPWEGPYLRQFPDQRPQEQHYHRQNQEGHFREE